MANTIKGVTKEATVTSSDISSSDVSSMSRDIGKLITELKNLSKKSSEEDKKGIEKLLDKLVKQQEEIKAYNETRNKLLEKSKALTEDQRKRMQDSLDSGLSSIYKSFSGLNDNLKDIGLKFDYRTKLGKEFKQTYEEILELNKDLKKIAEKREKREEKVQKTLNARKELTSNLKTFGANQAKTFLYNSLGPFRLFLDPLGGRDKVFSFLGNVFNSFGSTRGTVQGLKPTQKDKTDVKNFKDSVGKKVNVPRRQDLVTNGGTVGKAAGFLADVIEDNSNNCCCDDNDNNRRGNKSNPLTQLIPQSVVDVVTDIGKVVAPIAVGGLLGVAIEQFGDTAVRQLPNVNVNVPTPVVNVPAPVVNVPAPIVNVPAPVVNVNVTSPSSFSSPSSVGLPSLGLKPIVTSGTSKEFEFDVTKLPAYQQIMQGLLGGSSEQVSSVKAPLLSIGQGTGISFLEMNQMISAIEKEEAEENKKRKEYLIKAWIKNQGGVYSAERNRQKFVEDLAYSSLGITLQEVENVLAGRPIDYQSPLPYQEHQTFTEKLFSGVVDFFSNKRNIDAIGNAGRQTLRLTAPLIGGGFGLSAGGVPFNDAIIYKDNSVYVPHPDDNIVLTKDEVGTASVLSNSFESSLFDILNKIVSGSQGTVISVQGGSSFDFSALRV